MNKVLKLNHQLCQPQPTTEDLFLSQEYEVPASYKKEMKQFRNFTPVAPQTDQDPSYYSSYSESQSMEVDQESQAYSYTESQSYY